MNFVPFLASELPELPQLHVVDEDRHGELPDGAVGQVEVPQVRQRVQLILGQLAPGVLGQGVVGEVKSAKCVRKVSGFADKLG